jgi:hypothetical protein
MRRASTSTWEQVWEARHSRDLVCGQSWRNMPGTDPDQKKINFFLFKRGLLDDLPANVGPAYHSRLALLKRAGRTAIHRGRILSHSTTSE